MKEINKFCLLIPDPGSDHCSIPDSGGKKAPDPGSAKLGSLLEENSFPPSSQAKIPDLLFTNKKKSVSDKRILIFFCLNNTAFNNDFFRGGTRSHNFSVNLYINKNNFCCIVY
jgi:hypothetical protein